MRQLAVQEALARVLVEPRALDALRRGDAQGLGLEDEEMALLRQVPGPVVEKVADVLARKRLETLTPTYPRTLALLLGAPGLPATLRNAAAGVADPSDLLGWFPAFVETLPEDAATREAKSIVRVERALADLPPRLRAPARPPAPWRLLDAALVPARDGSRVLVWWDGESPRAEAVPPPWRRVAEALAAGAARAEGVAEEEAARRWADLGLLAPA